MNEKIFTSTKQIIYTYEAITITLISVQEVDTISNNYTHIKRKLEPRPKSQRPTRIEEIYSNLETRHLRSSSKADSRVIHKMGNFL